MVVVSQRLFHIVAIGPFGPHGHPTINVVMVIAGDQILSRRAFDNNGRGVIRRFCGDHRSSGSSNRRTNVIITR